MWLRLVLASLLVLITTQSSTAVDRFRIKESAGIPANEFGGPCAISTNTNGTAANYRWYNLCSGYIWIYNNPVAGEGVGVLFGGPAQPEVTGGNLVKRAITYWRNVVVNDGYNVHVYLDADLEGDGCPDYNIASDLYLDPGLRWNCSDFNVTIPCDLDYLIVRTVIEEGEVPQFATDGPFTSECDPISPARSFYYGRNGSVCIPWIGRDGNADNFLYWLIVDSAEPCPPNANSSTSWGAIKGLYR